MTAWSWQPFNAWAETWADYMLASLIDAAVGLVVVLAIWLLVRRHMPARWCYLLFLLVPLKTMIPWHVTVLPALTASRLEASSAQARLTAPESPATSFPERRMPAVSRSTEQGGGTRMLAAEMPPHEAVRPGPTRAALLMTIWALVIVLLGGRLCWNHLWLMSRLKHARPVDYDLSKANLPVRRGGVGRQRVVPVLISEQLEVPAAVGLCRPRIVLPAGLFATLPDRQIACVVAHEWAHLQWRDTWVALLERLVRIVHFFNPALWCAAHGAHVYREMACDEASLEAAGMDRRACGATLLGVLEFAQGKPSAASPAIAMFQRARFQQRRLRRIMAPHTIPRHMGWWSGLLLVAAAVLVLPNLRRAIPATAAEPAQSGQATDPSFAGPGTNTADDDDAHGNELITIAEGGPLHEGTYDLLDVVRDRYDLDLLPDLITDMVLPRSWSTTGSEGSIQVEADTRQLHVNQCAGAHAGVQRLLAVLGSAIRAQGAIAPPGSVLPAPRATDLFLQGGQLVRVYAVPSLLFADPKLRDPATADFDELIRVTTGVVGFDSWSDVGGPGEISVWPGGSCVVISQSRENHAQIEQLFALLHSLPGVNSGQEPASWEAKTLSGQTESRPQDPLAAGKDTRLYALHDLLPSETTPTFKVSPRAVGMEQLAAWLWQQAGPHRPGELVGLNLCRTKGVLILTTQSSVQLRIAAALADLRVRLKQAPSQEERTAITRLVFAPAFCALGWGGYTVTPEDTRPNQVYLHGACQADHQLAQLGPVADLVQEVQLIESDVTDNGLETLSTLGSVISLTIWSDRVTNGGVAKLAALNQLSYLSLHGTQVTDASAAFLGSLQNLHRLDIAHTSITDEGLKTLVAAMSSRRYFELHVGHTKVSAAAIESLRTAYPHILIVD